MRDDTRDCTSVGHIQFSSKVEEILRYQTHRKNAIRWARNLRFLTFESESAADEKGIAADDEIHDVFKKGQCARCEQRVPPSAGHICSSHGGYNNKAAVREHEQKSKQFSDPCVHVLDKACQACQHIPLFPTKKRATKFRIRRLKSKDTKPSELSHCTHFLAVSYCWQDSNRTTDVSENDLYDVIEEDGNVRKVRAPKDVIDRAVDFAAQNGFRMIWIDQECINQDDGPEKELGIQAMDIVYQRAHMSIGLFRTKFEKQRHLDALLLFFEMLVGTRFTRRGPHPLRQCRTLKFEVLAEALTMIMNDRWNTRGWILQEAFSASRRMTLLFPASKETSVKGWSLSCIAKSRKMIIARGLKLGVEDWDKTMESLRWFHPVPKPSHSFDFWIDGYKPKQTCNAAVALSFLRTRYNDRTADRLAIVANICDYSLRLNTIKLHESEHSLTLCIYVLALLNGDFSLLPPETYNIPRKLQTSNQLQSSDEFSWVRTSLKPLQYIDATIFNPSGPTVSRNTSNAYHISRHGFRLPGFLWKIDSFVELADIKHRYGESWKRLRARFKNKRNKTRTSKRGMTIAHAPTTKSHWLATTHILFEILMFLRDSGQVGVANSIWQSIMNPHWIKKQKKNPVESVLDFPSNLKLENRQHMFEIGVNEQEWCFQSWWLIDQVMSAGGIWVWTLEKNEEYDRTRKSSAEREVKDQPENVNSDVDILMQANVPQKREDNWRDENPFVANDPSSKEEEAAPLPTSETHRNMTSSTAGKDSIDTETNQQSSDFKKRGHAEKQFMASLLVKMFERTLEDDDDNEAHDFFRETENDQYLMTPEALTSLLRALTYEESENQYAIFDIDGSIEEPVWVLTPFNDLLETIPRPESRSMSTSWIIDVVTDVDLEADDGKLNIPILRAKGMVRGMWGFQQIPKKWYNLR